MAITYEQLFDTLRREKSRDELQQLEPEFYRHVQAFLAEKHAVIQRESARGLGSLAAQRAGIEYQNVRKILRELYDRRERKIVTMAMHRTRTDSAVIETESLLPQERLFFDELVGVLTRQRAEALAESTGEISYRPPVQEPEAHFRTQDEAPAAEASPAAPSGEIMVKFLSDVPKFVGKNLKVFGPYAEGDTASLPIDVAQILIRKGRAEEA